MYLYVPTTCIRTAMRLMFKQTLQTIPYGENKTLMKSNNHAKVEKKTTSL